MTSRFMSYFDRGHRGDEEFLIKVWPDDAFRALPVSDPKAGKRKDRRAGKSRD